MKQKTIAKDLKISGIGLHTGCDVNIVIKPSDVDTGISFVRTDLPNHPKIHVKPSEICFQSDMQRCTSIGQGESVIHTVEHLMSVLSGLGIQNVIIEIDAIELPGLDGSGLEFLKKIKKAGVLEQEKKANVFRVYEPVGVEANGSSIYIVPANDLKISYTLDYDHPQLRSQFYQTIVTPQTFENDIAPSRTFCMESEANALREHGLGKGANYQNTLVVGENGVLENKVRFPDEFARHKVLDFIGDLYLLGMPIVGHVFAVKSGHYLNLQILKKLNQQKLKWEKKREVFEFDETGLREISVEEIMRILPHRYPFLLVDRVIEIEKGKKAIGIKNVTINDNFFQGHFPSRPVMPGVLMVEAMAQTAGVTVLTNKAHRGKVAFFMAVDKVKFRKVVSPGDQLLMEVEVVRDREKTAQIRAQAKVGEEVVAEADMVFSFTDRSFLED